MLIIDKIQTVPETPALTNRAVRIKDDNLERLRKVIKKRYSVYEVFFRYRTACPNCNRPFVDSTAKDCKDFCCVACENGI